MEEPRTESSRIGRILEAVTTVGTQPWLLLITAVALIGLAIAYPFVGDKPQINVAFRAVVVVGLAELVFLLLSSRLTLRKLELQISAVGEASCIIEPPTTVSSELVSLLMSGAATELWIICYGTNKFGKSLDVVIDHCPHVQVHAIMCHPDLALHRSDKQSLRTVISELSAHPNITITQSHVPPTVRAALVKNVKGNPIWASLSYYNIYPSERGFRSEGISPIIRVSDPTSPLMSKVARVIMDEYKRLEQTTKSPLKVGLSQRGKETS